VCLAALTTTIVLAGTDIAIVAALRDFGQPGSIGWVVAVWGFGSLVGGLVYGALPRSISAFWLLGALGAVTAPMALATGAPSLAAWGFLAGLLCAPTITATVDQVSRLVPERVLGEAMGWHGSFMTAGMALGAPLAGAAIDRAGPPAGFVLVATGGLAVAVLGGLALRRRGAVTGATRADGDRSPISPVPEPAATPPLPG
jgi:MFS family permease